MKDTAQPGIPPSLAELAPPESLFSPEQDERCHAMVEKQLRGRGIRDCRVLAAMRAVPRHMFVPFDLVSNAYDDQPLPIGEGQTISQPYIVAAAAEALELTGAESVLEIGAGSGYQSAVLAMLAREVLAMEAHPALAAAAKERLARLHYRNVRIRVGDGSLGWSEAAPFDAILVSAAAPEVPAPLTEQLSEGGRLVVPVGPADRQQLLRVRRCGAEILTETLFECRFVPLIGQHGWSADEAGTGPDERGKKT